MCCPIRTIQNCLGTFPEKQITFDSKRSIRRKISASYISSLQAYGERNYHIFYEMLAGLPQEEKEKYSLKKAEDYAYLNQVFISGYSVKVLSETGYRKCLERVLILEGHHYSKDYRTLKFYYLQFTTLQVIWGVFRYNAKHLRI